MADKKDFKRKMQALAGSAKGAGEAAKKKAASAVQSAAGSAKTAGEAAKKKATSAVQSAAGSAKGAGEAAKKKAAAQKRKHPRMEKGRFLKAVTEKYHEVAAELKEELSTPEAQRDLFIGLSGILAQAAKDPDADLTADDCFWAAWEEEQNLALLEWMDSLNGDD